MKTERVSGLQRLAAYLKKRSPENISEKKLLELLEKQSDGCGVLAASENGEDTGVLLYDENTCAVRLLKADSGEAVSALLNELCSAAQRLHLGRIRAESADEKTVSGLLVFGFEKTDRNIYEFFLQKDMLGKTVTVVIDRPYGSLHPHIPDLECPYNFGYVKDSMTEDGAFQDAYVIGPDHPLDTFTGTVSGIIWRMETDTTRWIVTPSAQIPDREAVIRLIGEEEQYYRTKILWAK